jgi:hypothetical protein
MILHFQFPQPCITTAFMKSIFHNDVVAMAVICTVVILPTAAAETNADAATGWTDLLRDVDLPRQAVAGQWRKTEAGLVTEASTGARLVFSPRPADEYDFRVKFTRHSGVHSIALLFTAGNGQATFDIDGWGQNLAGIQQIGDRDLRNLPTRAENLTLENGRSYIALVQVRRGEVRAYLNDKLLATYRGDGADLSVVEPWRVPDKRALGIGAYEAATTFHQVEVRAVRASDSPTVVNSKPAVVPTPPPTTPARTEPAADDLAALSDEFNDPRTLTDWRRIFAVEGWGADQLERLDIGRTQSGWLTLVPYTSSWYRDYRGELIFKQIRGDFVATAKMRTSSRDGRSAPQRQFSLAGIMVRTPRDVTPTTWRPGGENYIFLSHGAADRPGTYQFEVKTTINSDSQLAISPANAAEAEIRVVRVGPDFLLLRRIAGQPWIVHRRYRRADMPAELQVGITAYTDWPKVERLTPAQHNRTVIRGGNPD